MIDGGMSSKGGCQDPMWNLAYPNMGRLAMSIKANEEMIGIEMSLFHKGTSFDKTQHNYIGDVCVDLVM